MRKLVLVLSDYMHLATSQPDNSARLPRQDHEYHSRFFARQAEGNSSLLVVDNTEQPVYVLLLEPLYSPVHCSLQNVLVHSLR